MAKWIKARAEKMGVSEEQMWDMIMYSTSKWADYEEEERLSDYEF